jgi:hypothetical protein
MAVADFDGDGHAVSRRTKKPRLGMRGPDGGAAIVMGELTDQNAVYASIDAHSETPAPKTAPELFPCLWKTHLQWARSKTQPQISIILAQSPVMAE